MNEKDLREWIDKHDAAAERNYIKHQETGDARYDRESRKHEEAADIGRIALETVDDHNKMITYKLTISDFVEVAKRLDESYDEEKAKKLMHDIAAAGKLLGIGRSS